MKTFSRLALAGFATIALAMPAMADDDNGSWFRHGWMKGGHMMERFGAVDGNDDGVISDDEAASQVESVFLAMDGDEDDELTMEEFMSVRMGPGAQQNEERQKARQDRKKARFADMDADKSGKVSKVEFIAAGKARFAAADSDKDGKVTPWEFRAQKRGW